MSMSTHLCPCRSTFVLLLFFFSWYGGHRDLHSFPTRRSSDLLPGRVAQVVVVVLVPMPIGGHRREIADSQPLPGEVPRSEEHTSELQSLAYLVCRLLLEKKKQNTSTRQETTPSSLT